MAQRLQYYLRTILAIFNYFLALWWTGAFYSRLTYNKIVVQHKMSIYSVNFYLVINLLVFYFHVFIMFLNIHQNE